MVLIKTALKNFKKGIVANVMTVFEIVAAIIVFLIMVSSFLIRYAYYEPFRDMIKGKGIYFHSAAGLNGLALSEDPETENYLLSITDKEMFGYLQGAEKIAGLHTLKFSYVNTGNNKLLTCYSYNDELIRRFTPDIKEGRWLNTSDKADKIEVVVSESDYGWKVGDELQITYGYMETIRNYNAEIVGIMEKGTKIFGLNNEFDKDENFTIMYKDYDTQLEGAPVFLFSSQYLANSSDEVINEIPQFLQAGIIQYSDNTTDEQLDHDMYLISRMAIEDLPVENISLENIEKYSKKYLYSRLYDLLPIVAVILILTVISSASSTAIVTQRRLHDYAVYYIAGLQWKHCTLINLIQSALTSVLALLLSAAAIGVIQLTPIADTVTIIPHLWTFSAVAALILLYILISMIMPAIIIGKSTPKEILAK